ncbi:MAG: 16S rRNA (guanine(527)-N(7))-methyltransferase RsmG [Anaerolineaceae bacterium]|nr:16S rRNA (guanine(527)-N(7))-methyltransferase RsmG [Anaerolineaceae bacterium]
MMDTLFQDAKAMLGIQLTKHQLSVLSTYENELLEWNRRHNLTALRERKTIRTKHFLDSFTCLLAMRDFPPGRLIDIGTGAGFPGIPLKILYPQCSLTLVESVAKKADFCRHIVNHLQLEAVEVLCERAEEVGQEERHRQQYDWAVARAVARLPVLMEYLLPLVRIGGKALAQKGEDALSEAHNADHAIHILGGRIKQLIPISLPGVVDERSLILVDKVAATPDRYPRRVGIPSKNPIQKGKNET